MITVSTKFEANDQSSAAALVNIFKKLLAETNKEQGYIDYQVLSDKNNLYTYYIFEKWQSEGDLQLHADAVARKGYAKQAMDLIRNQIESIILQNLNL